ncbi:MAG TPA: hypothetical protein VIG66_10510 [Noviherbaspirillum sp.]
MIVTRAVYDAVVLISRAPVQYDASNSIHQTAIEAGVAEVNGAMLELTHKGALVLDL